MYVFLHFRFICKPKLLQTLLITHQLVCHFCTCIITLSWKNPSWSKRHCIICNDEVCGI